MENNINENGSCCQHKKCGKVVVMIVGMLLLAGIVTIAILRDRIVTQQFNQITVVGQGRVPYTPDIAIINLGVQIDKAKSAEDALNQLNAKMATIITAVKAEGVADSDVETANYNLSPQIEYGNNNVASTTGYNANQQLSVKVREFDQKPEKLNTVIAAAGKAGVNQVNSLLFDSSKINELKQQARLIAIKDAKQRSVILADAAGVKIKNIANWYENLIQPQPMYNMMNNGMGGGPVSAPQVPGGTREVIIEMSVNYNLK
ncbi:MAG: SIMPL domain-containing protein [Candidatus Falkowbacteria bacterium]|nr:SIMPL domain-containing protein [Candidatus Falkowbacteria bacterium]